MVTRNKYAAGLQSNMSSGHSSDYNTEDEGTPNKLGSSAPAMVETSLKSSGVPPSVVPSSSVRADFTFQMMYLYHA